MANEQNLRTPTHEEAVAMGKKGGAGNITNRGSFKKQKWCQNTCAFWSSCPAISTSQSLGPVGVGLKKHRPCFIKKQPQEIQNYFLNLFCDGEPGLIKVIMDLHFRLMLKTQSSKISAKELRESLTASLDMKKGIYGDKQKIEHSGMMEVKAEISITEKIKEYEKFFIESETKVCTDDSTRKSDNSSNGSG